MNTKESFSNNKNLIALSAAKLLSGFASYIYDIGIVIYLYDRTESAAVISGFFVAQLLPTFFLVWFGKTIDRYNKKHLMILCNVTKAVLFLLLLVSSSLTCIYLVTFFMNLILEYEGNVVQSILPEIFPTGEILRAASVVNVLDSFSMVLAPLCASALALNFPMEANIILDILLYVGTVAVYIWMKTASTEPTRRECGDNVLKPYKYILTNKKILFTVISWGIFMFCIGIAAPLEILMIEQKLQMPSAYYGFGNTVEGIGMLVASVLLLGLVRKLGSVSIIKIGLFTATASYFILGISYNMWMYFFGACLVGVTATLCPLGFKTLLQIEGEPQVMGQMFTASRFFVLLSRVAGSAVVGTALGMIGIRGVYYLVGFILLGLALWYCCKL